MVVLDGYVFDVPLQRRLRARAPLVVVDDLQLPADCDIAVNPSPGGEDLRPAGATTFLGGAAYALIRTAIVEARSLCSVPWDRSVSARSDCSPPAVLCKIESVSGLINLVMMPMWIFSGVFFSYERFPAVVQPLIKLRCPLTALNDALRATILEGTPLFHQWSRLLVLIFWAVSFFHAGVEVVPLDVGTAVASG